MMLTLGRVSVGIRSRAWSVGSRRSQEYELCQSSPHIDLSLNAAQCHTDLPSAKIIPSARRRVSAFYIHESRTSHESRTRYCNGPT